MNGILARRLGRTWKKRVLWTWDRALECIPHRLPGQGARGFAFSQGWFFCCHPREDRRTGTRWRRPGYSHTPRALKYHCRLFTQVTNVLQASRVLSFSCDRWVQTHLPQRFWATWSRWGCPCSQQRGWSRRPLKVPSHRKHSVSFPTGVDIG